MLELFLAGAVLFFQLENLIWIFIGVFSGVIIGSLPGLGPLMVIALLLPVSLWISPIASIGMFMGIYKGAIFGGSISAILLNMPGTGASTATAEDGFALCKQGKAGKALEAAMYASVFGDTFSDFLLLFFAPALAAVALRFGPAENFMIVLFSLTVIGYVSTGTFGKGMIMASLGLFFSLVGMDTMVGVSRFTLGYHQLNAGISFLPMIIGLFAFSEILVQYQKVGGMEKSISDNLTNIPKKGDFDLSFQEFTLCFRSIMRSSIIGSIIGILPGIGADIGAWVCYSFAKRFSKRPEEFGKGSLEGVAAAESGNNAVCGANLIPLLGLGIPGSPVAAILLGALTIYGITPGPRVFMEHGPVIYAIIIGIIIANGFNFIIAKLLLKRIGRFIVSLPYKFILPPVVALAVFGAYSANSRLFDVNVMLFFAVLGYLARLFKFPLAPLLIAYILGPLAEISLRQALLISGGNLSIFIERPISLIFFMATILSLGGAIYSERYFSKKVTG